MMKILFVNACVRPGSRTVALAETVLKKLDGYVEEVKLYQLPMEALDLKGLKIREDASQKQDFSDPVFDLAKQFSMADAIVIATPFWDLMFPTVLKTYLENIMVSGITFCYSDHGETVSLCKAKSLYYVTTAGGFCGQNDFGFSYIKALAQNFFGITQIHRYSAEGLDIMGADVEKILNDAKAAINADISEHM